MYNYRKRHRSGIMSTINDPIELVRFIETNKVYNQFLLESFEIDFLESQRSFSFPKSLYERFDERLKVSNITFELLKRKIPKSKVFIESIQKRKINNIDEIDADALNKLSLQLNCSSVYLIGFTHPKNKAYFNCTFDELLFPRDEKAYFSKHVDTLKRIMNDLKRGFQNYDTNYIEKPESKLSNEEKFLKHFNFLAKDKLDFVKIYGENLKKLIDESNYDMEMVPADCCDMAKLKCKGEINVDMLPNDCPYFIKLKSEDKNLKKDPKDCCDIVKLLYEGELDEGIVPMDCFDRKKLNTRSLAKILNCSHMHINKIVNAKYTNINFEFMLDITKLFGCTPDYLLGLSKNRDKTYNDLDMYFCYPNRDLYRDNTRKEYHSFKSQLNYLEELIEPKELNVITNLVTSYSNYLREIEKLEEKINIANEKYNDLFSEIRIKRQELAKLEDEINMKKQELGCLKSNPIINEKTDSN